MRTGTAMGGVVPLDVFEPVPLLITEPDGRIGACNAAATRLLAGRAATAAERPCWEIVGFRTPCGAAFCSSHCAVQDEVGRAQARVFHRVILPGRDAADTVVDLLALPLPPETPGPRGVLHLLLPTCGEVVAESPPEPSVARRLRRLTPREAQILHLIGQGSSTREIAQRLFISPATVRNHVQHILRKLRVHGRLAAALVDRSASASPAHDEEPEK